MFNLYLFSCKNISMNIYNLKFNVLFKLQKTAINFINFIFNYFKIMLHLSYYLFIIYFFITYYSNLFKKYFCYSFIRLELEKIWEFILFKYFVDRENYQVTQKSCTQRYGKRLQKSAQDKLSHIKDFLIVWGHLHCLLTL